MTTCDNWTASANSWVGAASKPKSEFRAHTGCGILERKFDQDQGHSLRTDS